MPVIITHDFSHSSVGKSVKVFPIVCALPDRQYQDSTPDLFSFFWPKLSGAGDCTKRPSSLLAEAIYSSRVSKSKRRLGRQF